MGPEKKPGTWSFSLVGGAVRKLRDDDDLSIPSPDGSLVAVLRDNAIWIMDLDGENPRKLVAAEKGRWVGRPEWSPDGRRLAYPYGGPEGIAIESRDSGGGPPATIIPSNSRVGDSSSGRVLAHMAMPTPTVCWARDGYIVYLMAEPPPNENSNNFWEVSVDPRTGRPTSAPRRISKWLGYWLSSPRVSADGKRLGYLKGHSHSNIYVAQLEGGGTCVTEDVQQLTFDIRVDWFGAWTRDCKAVLFYSDRKGTFDIFRQRLGERQPEPVVVGSQEKRDPQISPDGSWIVYFAYDKIRDGSLPSTGRIMRVPVSGGQPQFVAQVKGYPGCANCAHLDSGGPHPALRCPTNPNALCVLSEVEQSRVVFTSINVATGKKNELFRVDAANYWDLSPDGSRIAFGDPNAGCEIRILTVAGVTERTLAVKGKSSCIAAAWPQRGDGLFVESYTDVKSTLLRVSWDGEAKPLRTSLKWFRHFGESPDGKYLAFTDVIGDSNAWMIENF